MRIEGDKLLVTLAKQDVPVRVVDATGRLDRLFRNPKDVLKFVATGGYFGLGNHRRISVLQPLSEADQRAVFCGKQTDRLTLDYPLISHPAERISQRGVKWKPRLADSRPGLGSSPRMGKLWGDQ